VCQILAGWATRDTAPFPAIVGHSSASAVCGP
jgi:hypothetical protein